MLRNRTSGIVRPVFGLIDAYRAAARVAAAASEEKSRREQILTGRGHRTFSVRRRRQRWGSPIVVYSHKQIDQCPTLFGQQRDRAHVRLDVALSRHSTILGDVENVLCDAIDAGEERLDALLSTAPTSVPGLRALLHYILADDDGPTCEDELSWNARLETLLFSIGDALDNIDVARAEEII
ncbi:hypothetical protein ABIB82_006495 [Bradyrhizobium sp. i1.8.4]|uniref:hypothetical protein n=1 Tax=unclassified Bradyrhizobium TaxID=2631580 RepID=UPI003D21350A